MSDKIERYTQGNTAVFNNTTDGISVIVADDEICIYGPQSESVCIDIDKWPQYREEINSIVDEYIRVADRED